MEIWWMCWNASTKSLLYLQHALICVCVYVWNAEQQPSYCPGSALCMRKTAQRCVWSDSLNLLQLSSNAMTSFAPPECVMNVWHNRISQWSYFKSPLAQGKGCCLLYEHWITCRVGGGWRDMMVEMLIWMSFRDWAILELKRMQHHLGGFGPAKIIVFIPQSFRVFLLKGTYYVKFTFTCCLAVYTTTL